MIVLYTCAACPGFQNGRKKESVSQMELRCVDRGRQHWEAIIAVLSGVDRHAPILRTAWNYECRPTWVGMGFTWVRYGVL